MGKKNIFGKLRKVACIDERGREVTYGQLMSTTYMYEVASEKLTQHAFDEGKYQGKKEGYVEASYEYEQKLLKQAEEFTEQSNFIENQRDEYEKLLDEYEAYIDKLTEKNELTPVEKDYMNQIMIMERKLKKMK